MAWNGSICDISAARRSAGSALLAQNLYSVLAASLSSVAVAQAAVATNASTMSICDQWGVAQCQVGYQVASNLGGTFDGVYADLYNSLPDSAGHPRAMFCS